jgi:uncharacterized membrane protein YfcA
VSFLSLDLLVFLTGTLVAGFVVGVTGFAFALVAAAFWFHVLTPAETVTLIIGYALLVQGFAVWKLRAALLPSRLWPFVVGSALGIPLGIALLSWLPADQIRVGVGLLLVLFSAYSLWRPAVPTLTWAGKAADGVIGIVNGALGSSTGLAGIVLVVWSGLRGWNGVEQRAVFQPIAVATFLMCLVAFGGTGTLSPEVGRLFLIGLPALIVGTTAGWASYGKLDESQFRKIVLALLLVSGIALIASVTAN